MASSSKKKTKGKTKGKYAYDSGLEISRQLGEEAITVASPKARFLMNTARITGTGHLDFVKTAINNCLLNDTLEKIRTESNMIVVERIISAIVSGKFKDHIEESEEIEEDDDE